ncbi:GABA transporter 1-like [Cryptomeria japonica]|uniref:GABA transporter 1-like n=1 Tax=Cryptomeria japonica TaxID=3369 RepID=UPI0027DA7D1F|nr:GABA transporter 1-like [Cryptomeria japonica]
MNMDYVKLPSSTNEDILHQHGIGGGGGEETLGSYNGGDNNWQIGDSDGDGGAAFVLVSKGTWWHAGFHLTTAIVGPAILTLPYAFSCMGWTVGLLSLSMAGAVSFYSYYLMSRVLDNCEKNGRRHIRFRELASDILEGKHQRTRVEQQDKGNIERTSTVPVIQAMTGSILDMPFLIFSFVLVHTYMYISFLHWMHVASLTALCVGRMFEYE